MRRAPVAFRRGREKAKETLRESDEGDGEEEEKAQARRTAFAIVQKEQPNAFNAYINQAYTSGLRALRSVSQKVTSNPAKNTTQLHVDHASRDERTMGLEGVRQKVYVRHITPSSWWWRARERGNSSEMRYVKVK